VQQQTGKHTDGQVAHSLINARLQELTATAWRETMHVSTGTPAVKCYGLPLLLDLFLAPLAQLLLHQHQVAGSTMAYAVCPALQLVLHCPAAALSWCPAAAAAAAADAAGFYPGSLDGLCLENPPAAAAGYAQGVRQHVVHRPAC
jgi:hypothetical protein